MRFFILILIALTSSNLYAKSSLSGTKPNIIFVMTDDQGYGDFACHGHPYLKTPNLDKLYTQSMRLTDYHASPTCAPTRAALMSGRAPFKNGVTHTILERDRMTLKATTIAQLLKKAGYTTGIFGKRHLGGADPYQPHNRGFDETFIHGAGGIGQNFPGAQGDAPGTGYFNPYKIITAAQIQHVERLRSVLYGDIIGSTSQIDLNQVHFSIHNTSRVSSSLDEELCSPATT